MGSEAGAISVVLEKIGMVLPEASIAGGDAMGSKNFETFTNLVAIDFFRRVSTVQAVERWCRQSIHVELEATRAPLERGHIECAW